MFYDNFLEICKAQNTTPAQVRKALGISQSTMASWKSRGLTPKYETLQKLAEYLGVSINTLYNTPLLPDKEIPIVEGGETTTINSAFQEFIAFNDLLDGMGYHVFLDLGTFGNINPSHDWTLVDSRREKKYFVTSAKLSKLLDNVTSFTKYHINEMISELQEIPQYQSQSPQGTPLAPSEDKDTTHPENPSEGPQEGTEDK